MITISLGIAIYLITTAGIIWNGGGIAMFFAPFLDAGCICFIAYCFGNKKNIIEKR